MKLTNNILEEFIEEYKNTPGMLGVQDDGYYRKTIFVFMDKTKFPKDFPTTYNEFPIYLYDIKSTLNEAKNLKKEFDIFKPDMRNPNVRKLARMFEKTTLVCNKLLNETQA